MKKKLAILMCGTVLSISVLTGCAKEATPTAQGTTAAASTTKPVENVTLKYYNWDSEGEAKVTKALIDKFQQNNPNIKVESIALVPGNSVESLKKLDVTISSGEQMDVMLMPGISETMARTAQGVFAPLDDYYAKDNVKPADEYYVSPNFKGKNYATMYNRANWFVLFNQNALDEAGLKVPEIGWTWDDYREYAKKLTKGEGNAKRYGSYFHNWSDYTDPILFIEKRNTFLKEDGTTQFDDPSVKSFFNLRKAMEKDDKTVKPFADVVSAKLAYRSEFFNEKAAMIVSGSWMVADSVDVTKNPHNFKVAFAPVPRSSTSAELGLTNIDGQFMAVANNSKHKEESYKFIRYMSTNYTNGLAGWKKADDKKVIDALIEPQKQFINVDSLDKALFDKKIHAPQASEIAAPYGQQLKNLMLDGFSKFILDNTSAEEAQKYLVDQANKIIQENKK